MFLEPILHRISMLILSAKCQLTIGMRLHALIFSTLTSVPHIGLSYDKKVESLLKRNGMWEFSAV